MRCALALAATLFAASPSWAVDSIYTSLDAECRVVAEQEEGAYAELICPAPAGWGVKIVDFDSRSHLVLQHEGQEYSLQREMIDEFGFGMFPSVGKKAEWWIGQNGPQALIVRMYYMKDDASRSILMVFRLNPEPVLVGTTTSNQAARELADR
jgi:hypothetical protein